MHQSSGILMQRKADLALIPVDLDRTKICFPKNASQTMGVGRARPCTLVFFPWEIQRARRELMQRIGDTLTLAIVRADMAVARDNDDAMAVSDQA